MRDVAHVHDGFQVQTNSVSVNGTPGALMTIRKTGGVSTLAVIDGVRAALKDIKKVLPADVAIKPLFDQSLFVKAALNSVGLSAGYGRRADRAGHHPVSRQHAPVPDHSRGHSLVDHHRRAVHCI